MKKIIVVAMVSMLSGMMVAGCGQKEAAVKPADVDKGRQLLMEGTVFLKQGDVRKAVESYASAIKESPDSFDAYFMLAQTFIHLKQFPQAQAVLTAAAQRFPDNPTLFYFLAIAYQGGEEVMPAIVAARKSVDLFHARNDDDGEKRATILLGVLVQVAKAQAEAKMVDTAAQAAAQAVEATN
ncbi:MAG: tetratricopeptide repeat protein [Candidatus Omnitrophota bacterium]